MRKFYYLLAIMSMLICCSNVRADEPPTTDGGHHITLLFGVADPIFMNKGKTVSVDNNLLRGVRVGDYLFVSCALHVEEMSEPSIFQFLDSEEQPLATLPQLTLEAPSTKIAITPENFEDVKNIGAVYGKNLWIQLVQVSRDVLRGISINKSKATLKPGAEMVLEGAPIPRSSFFLIGWKSSDETVATVDAGIVHANAIGTSVITTYIVGSEETEAKCNLEVTRDGQPTTSVETLNNDNEFITVYNTQGIRILDNAPAAELESLPSGLYIVNGKKRFIK